MKTLKKKIFLFILLPLVITAQHHSTDKPSTHGMLLMGTNVIYASHLPMFHTPHDYQIIIALKLSEKDKAIYLSDKQANPDENIYTLEPETFVLPDKVKSKGSFKAAIYRGHFERGGVKILNNIEVAIDDIIYYKKFEAEAMTPAKKEYLLFGNKKEQFLAHIIVKRPDFDEVLAIQLDMTNLSTTNTKKYVSVVCNETNERKPCSWGTSKLQLKDSEKVLEFKNPKTLYLEYGDLE